MWYSKSEAIDQMILDEDYAVFYNQYKIFHFNCNASYGPLTQDNDSANNPESEEGLCMS